MAPRPGKIPPVILDLLGERLGPFEIRFSEFHVLISCIRLATKMPVAVGIRASAPPYIQKKFFFHSARSQKRQPCYLLNQ